MGAVVPDDDELHVLFVCTANISRSPYMERIARHRVGGGKVRFSSAGVHAQDDTLIDPAMAIELTSRGIGSDDFRSRRLTGVILAEADLVLTAEAAHRARILDEHPIATRKVLTFGQADEAMDRVDLGIAPTDVPAALVAARRGASGSLDVVDPYRRGPEAARIAALEIDGLVERLLARLVRVTS
jgi:sulfate adenylyltransferase